MDCADRFRMCAELPLTNAALLLGCKTSSEMVPGVEQLPPEQRPMKYEAAKASIRDALLHGDVEGKMRSAGPEGIMGSSTYVSHHWFEAPGAIDADNSTVVMASLKRWAASRADTNNLLFGERSDIPGYLDKRHPHYSSKLAAAVKVWLVFEGVDEPEPTPRQAVEAWLLDRAADLGLLHEIGTLHSGKLNQEAFDQVAGVANWKYGGPRKTPGG